MYRAVALLLTALCLILFILTAYVGARLSLFSSCAFGFLVALILLFFFYSPLQNIREEPDLSMFFYVGFVMLAIVFLLVYLLIRILTDVRASEFCQAELSLPRKEAR